VFKINFYTFPLNLNLIFTFLFDSPKFFFYRTALIIILHISPYKCPFGQLGSKILQSLGTHYMSTNTHHNVSIDTHSASTRTITSIKFNNSFNINTLDNIKPLNNQQIYIVPEYGNEDVAQVVYNSLRKYDPIILCSTKFACGLKYVKSGLYVILCEMCELHEFEYYTVLDDKCRRRIVVKEGNGRVFVDTANENIMRYYQMRYGTVSVGKSGDMKNSDSQLFMSNDDDDGENTAKCQENNESCDNAEIRVDQSDNVTNAADNVKDALNIIEEFDRVKFLISRLSRVQKAKDSTIFGIYFTNFKLEEFAYKIREYLISKGKKTYMYYLRDISYERLTCMDGIECVVIVDCHYHTLFDISISIPIVVPFELNLAFDDGEWDGMYDINTFSEARTDDNKCTGMVISDYYSTGDLIKRNEAQCVNFYVEQFDDKIYDGLDGIAGSYKQVGEE
ncbi:Diphthamide biosynthesis protein, partial [Trachipleistophora hominis]